VDWEKKRTNADSAFFQIKHFVPVLIPLRTFIEQDSLHFMATKKNTVIICCFDIGQEALKESR